MANEVVTRLCALADGETAPELAGTAETIRLVASAFRRQIETAPRLAAWLRSSAEDSRLASARLYEIPQAALLLARAAKLQATAAEILDPRQQEEAAA